MTVSRLRGAVYIVRVNAHSAAACVTNLSESDDGEHQGTLDTLKFAVSRRRCGDPAGDDSEELPPPASIRVNLVIRALCFRSRLLRVFVPFRVLSWPPCFRAYGRSNTRAARPSSAAPVAASSARRAAGTWKNTRSRSNANAQAPWQVNAIAMCIDARIA